MFGNLFSNNDDNAYDDAETNEEKENDTGKEETSEHRRQRLIEETKAADAQYQAELDQYNALSTAKDYDYDEASDAEEHLGESRKVGHAPSKPHTHVKTEEICLIAKTRTFKYT